MTAMTVREATGIKATVQIPGCRKLMFSCSCSSLAIQGCICSHWSQDIFKRNIKMTKLYRGFTSIELAESLHWIHCAPQGVYSKIFFLQSWMTWPCKTSICKITMWNIWNMDPMKESFCVDLPAGQPEPSEEVLVVLGRTSWGLPCPSIGHRVSERTLQTKMYMLSWEVCNSRQL